MDNNYYKNKVKWCPICDQGWVQIFKEKSTKKLVLVCDECFSEWENPEFIARTNSLPSKSNDIILDPTDEEIENKGWATYVIT